ncbi:hypothetical protein C8J57DRAFT_1308523 [Mycena rebaudengoi]|nr:hypothetical protein C8J57DRAFT_1308523 [Mycena rebaudengoi]
MNVSSCNRLHAVCLTLVFLSLNSSIVNRLRTHLTLYIDSDPGSSITALPLREYPGQPLDGTQSPRPPFAYTDENIDDVRTGAFERCEALRRCNVVI